MKKLDRLIKHFASHLDAAALVSTTKAAALEDSVRQWLPLDPPELNAIFGDPEKGLPMGRMAMLYSEPSHGKTTLLLHLLGLVQKAGGLAALSPIEGSYQVEWAKRLGVDTENLILVELGFRPLVKTVRGKEKIIGYEPEGLETLFAKYELLLDAKQEEMPDAPMLIGWDSITATPTKAELEGEYEEQDKAMALQARALSKGLRKLHQRLMASNTTLISIVQTRTKIGGFSFKAPTGGQALAFYNSIEVKLNKTTQRAKVVKERRFSVNVRNNKNKVGEPYAEEKFVIDFDKGIELLKKKGRGRAARTSESE